MTAYLLLRSSLLLLIIIQPFVPLEARATPNIPQFANDLLAYSQDQVWATAQELPPNKRKFPWYTTDGSKWFTPVDTFWTSAYLSGCLWFQYLLTGNSKYLTEAERHGAELQQIVDTIIRDENPHNGPVLLMPFIGNAVVRSKTKTIPRLPLRKYEAAIVKTAEAFAVK